MRAPPSSKVWVVVMWPFVGAIGDVWGDACVEEDLDVFGSAGLGGGYEEVCRNGFCAGRVEGLFLGFLGG